MGLAKGLQDQGMSVMSDISGKKDDFMEKVRQVIKIIKTTYTQHYQNPLTFMKNPSENLSILVVYESKQPFSISLSNFQGPIRARVIFLLFQLLAQDIPSHKNLCGHRFAYGRNKRIG